MNLYESLRCFIPELILVLEALIILVLVMVNLRRLIGLFAMLGLVVAFGLLLFTSRYSGRLFEGAIVLDPFGLFFKGLCIIVSLITVLFSLGYRSLNDPRTTKYHLGSLERGEYYAILLLCTVGMCLLGSTTDLLMAYIALETVSLSSYLLTSFLKGDRKSSEAGLKYVIYGAIASGVMIYGMSLLYGITGSTRFVELSHKIQGDASALLLVSFLMILAGFGFKIAMVPFHMWCPDVYEGAPTPITAFLSVGPKAAGFAILIRFGLSVLPLDKQTIEFPWQTIISVLSVATMFVGNLAALWQNNLKRLLAYSSIAHCGYMLMGVVFLSHEALTAVLIYLVIYLFMNMGAFLVVLAVAREIASEEVPAYRGLGWRAPLPCVIMVIFLFSLTGIPPLAGFIGKFYIFAELVRQKWYWLAVIGVLNTVISLYYYARVIRAMFLEKPIQDDEKAIEKLTFSVRISPYYATLLVLISIPILVVGVWWTPLFHLAQESLKFIK